MRHSPYRLLPVVVALLLVNAAAALAREPEVQPNPEGVRAAAKKYLQAKARGDVETLKRMWTPEGEYIDVSGQRCRAWEVIAEQGGRPQAEVPDAAVPLPDSTLRFITRDVAVEDGTLDQAVAGHTVRFTAIWVRRDGQWLLDSLRESLASLPSPHDHLQPLSWLLGEWVGTAEDATILVSSHWSEGGNFIVREFLIRSDEHEPVSGTQRIGWDATAGKIKSWAFDSQGGTGEGLWSADDEGWRVRSKEKTADGKEFTTTAVYRPVDENRFVWQVRTAQGDEEDLPPLRVEFRRAPEDAGN